MLRNMSFQFAARVRFHTIRSLGKSTPFKNMIYTPCTRTEMKHAARALAITQNPRENGSRSNFAARFLMLSCAAFIANQFLFDSRSVECCGIVGVVGADDASGFIMEGLTILRNRGYDSAGMATLDATGEDITITKYASRESTADSIDLLRNNCSKHIGHVTGIGHTRWATHGGKTDYNAHPHTDQHKRVAVIHNGTINNAYDLKKELLEKGVKFSSETDTEVIAQLIGQYLDKGMDTKDAVVHALGRCDGSWGLAVISKNNPQEIIAACNGSPLMIGLGQNKMYIASEISAFSKYTKNYIAMKDGEIGVIRALEHNLDIGRVETAPDQQDIALTPDPYPHFTLKECYEQPEAIARALSYGARMNDGKVILGGLDKNAAQMATIKNMLLTACGTSKHAAEFGAKVMRDLDCFDSVSVLDAAEVRRADIPKRHGGMLAVSQSGETKDVFRAVKVGEEVGVPRISVVNTVGSLIARSTGLGVYLNAGRENAVASTKAFSTQVTVLTLIALWFRQQKEEREGLPSSPLKKEMLEALQRLPISFGMAFRLHDKCKKIAAKLTTKESMFVLGKGYAEPIAMEGALKIKEMTYIHAEGYSGGALKHGPFALIEGKEGAKGQTPVIVVILDDDHAMQMRTAAEEVKARGAMVIVITDNAKLAQGIDPEPLIIPNNGPLTALIAALPLQLIAYELAVLRGVNPDVPRNLAKAVTTD
jgi:glucosamine--fructose-6-phosphate aminotransferase (isomerizing)